jgi:hypothetical protein
VRGSKDRSANAFFVVACPILPISRGVTVTSSSADSAAVFGYLAGGLPSKTATETDSSGLAGWENYPAGPTTITITKVSTGQKLLTFDYFVRSRVVANVALPPGQP